MKRAGFLFKVRRRLNRLVYNALGLAGMHGLQGALFIKCCLPDPADVRLLLGCGTSRREGWVNIDADRTCRPDVVCSITRLAFIPSGSVSEIDSQHMFEHLTYADAVAALQEWHRALRPGAKLCIELPNLKRCAEILYKHESDEAVYYAMMGLYGQVPGDRATVSLYQLHKYGWTPESLRAELTRAGFADIKLVGLTQTFRPATRYDRDMRVECIKASERGD